jgi:hypothetical protein
MYKAMKNFTLFLAVLVMSLPLAAQHISISGSVYSLNDQKPLNAANIIIKIAEKPVVSALTDESGRFIIRGLKAEGSLQLEISYLGFKPYLKVFPASAMDIDAGRIYLELESRELAEIRVEAKNQIATMKGDTLSYNSGAFKTNPDATAEDLVKKMPGIEVSGSDVKAQGESVKKVTVDGKPFFDQDASLTLKTLPAMIVDKIEIFDEQSEQAKITGFDDGNTSKTMNIVTHQNMRSGSFGRFYAGYGNAGYYQAGGNYNLFKGDRRISLLGMTNNINMQNFSPEDLLGISSGGGMGGGMRGGGTAGMGNQSGLATTSSIGLNYSDSWGKKITVTGSYFFNKKKTEDLQTLQQDYFTSDASSKIYNETSTSSSTNDNHRFNLRLEYKIDSSNYIMFLPRLSFQSNNSFTGNEGSNVIDGLIQNLSNSDLKAERSGYNYSNDLLYSHNFKKKGRTLSLFTSFGSGSQNGDSWQNSLSEYYGNTVRSDSIRNFADNRTGNRTVSGRLAWTEPISKKSSVMVDVGRSNRLNTADKQTFNFNSLNSEYDLRDTSLSNTLESHYNSVSTSIGYRYRAEKLMLISSIQYELSDLTADRTFPLKTNIDHRYGSILPGGMLRYDFSKTTRLRVFYRSNSSSPSVTQLQDVADKSNPLQISVGNSRLRPSVQHNVFMRFSRNNVSSASSFFALLGGGITNNYIANSTIIAVKDTLLPGNISLLKGSRFTRPVNMDGYRNMRSFINYGIPLTNIKSNLNLNVSWNYSRIPGMMNGTQGFSDNHTAGLGAVLSSNISENIDFTVSTQSGYNHSISNLEKSASQDYFSLRSGLQLNLIFLHGTVFSTDINHQFYSGLSGQYDNNYLLWNCGLAKKFFKDNSGELKISVYDILKQNTSFNRTVTDAYIQDSQNKVLGQYAMLTFTYKLKNFTETKQKNDWIMGPHDGDGPPMRQGERPGNMRPSDGGMPPFHPGDGPPPF